MISTRPASIAAPPWRADRSLWMLLLVNGAILVVAVVDHWNTIALMAAYWVQSVIIGISNVFRIRALDRFSTAGFSIGGKAAEPTPQVRNQTATFFAFHYGIFHAGYLLFLLKGSKAAGVFDGWFLACTVALAINHAFSYRANAEQDRKGTPNIGTLMFTPYLRVVPMHLTIVLGAFFISSTAGLLLFGVLKTVADVLMHIVEHATLRKDRVQT